ATLSKSLPVFLLCAASPLAAQMSPLRYPTVAGGQIRIEGYLVPRVTSWPSYPSWSPDGRGIAFSMDGRIWVVPAEGGEATQVSSGEGYDFEPDWSPDGRKIVFSRDVGANLDIHVLSLDDASIRRLTDAPALEFHPRWEEEGGILYTSAVSGNFDLHRLSLETGAPAPLYDWPSNEIQADPSPIAGDPVFVSSRSGRVGTGGLFVGGREVHFEETSFRTRPAFSPDGRTIAFISDADGSRQVWLLPTEGGVPLPLTRDPRVDAFAPAWSPDGEEMVYVVNRGGKGSLEIQPLHGGSPRTLPIGGRRYPDKAAMGRLEVVLEHPARVSLIGSDGRYHAPADAFRRIVSFTELHYFHASKTFTVDVPSGKATILAVRGPEYEPMEEVVDVPPGGAASARIDLPRFVDMPARNFYSGDTHVHDLHAGDLRLAPEDLVGHAAAEDLHVVNALIHVDGTKLMGDVSRFSAGPHPASTDDVILRYGQEYRMSFGHRSVLGNERMFFPLESALPGSARESPFPPLFEYLRRLRKDEPRALVGIPHPYFAYLAKGELPGGGAPSEIPADVALGLVDFFDVNCIWSDEHGSAAIYAKLLNAGFRLPAAGGSDTFSDLSRDPPLGTGRTFVKVEGKLSLESWYEGLRAGRSFATNGPLLDLDVDGRGFGEELQLELPGKVAVRANARSFVPMEKMVVLVNGKPFASREGPSRELTWRGEIDVEESVWIAVQAEGGSSPFVTDTYLFAHSTPVWVMVAGKPVLVEEDRAYLERYLDALVDYTRKVTGFRSERERELTIQGFSEARDRVRAMSRSLPQ
ncbi:MAG: CehA/McbA family metallohydrolase, partial [Vicinamibacteria bacterium]